MPAQLTQSGSDLLRFWPLQFFDFDDNKRLFHLSGFDIPPQLCKQHPGLVELVRKKTFVYGHYMTASNRRCVTHCFRVVYFSRLSIWVEYVCFAHGPVKKGSVCVNC
ncbi:MAG: hypothetical protein KKG92_12980, partial [Gammaproteobacteria bacterium]|nr:hypothetical protein [Gammaproteobacteria bacterium]